ncbi:chemotaxis protein CheB [Aquabacterium sp.]|uniref:chemotaxis protein CheB n=1 Tax=Aquabacterium sp. TaxID=1872578 RepID=UPI002E301E66|nr:chemotaxis protein CheB [Aquabacterium sp.]HEX5311963.1 chemotaxis protein CheB [Aquabacterium sp.]
MLTQTAIASHSPPERIVGLGASAGGLVALEHFLSRVPEASGLAYVVVQHMDPTHKTMLSVLLQRATAMPVHEAADSMVMEANAVYVIPPDCELTVAQGRLRINTPKQPRGLRLPIDVLFSSLAQSQGEKAIGVVLSGMGSDGTVGLQSIKMQGGLTLAQQPDTAQFDSMPQAAIASGFVDIVASPEDMPQHILRVVRSGRVPDFPPKLPAPKDDAESLATILKLLREHSNRDLSLYKTSTLMRRIDRRVGVHGLPSIAAYAEFLSRNPHELDLLFAEMLIGVTSFFRDADLWTDLKERVLPEFLESRRADTAQLRAWIVGCSTGEEAYSLAMVLQEVLAEMREPPPLSFQIFATDLSAEAITFARKGVYSARSVEGMDEKRLSTFFAAQSDGSYLIDKRIRDMVLFAQHDVILDPPFTKLDILSCRNVLIYFNAALQNRLMPLFHYSLRPKGLLMLGGSETVGRSQSLFTPLNAKARLYRRSDRTLNAGAVDFPINRPHVLHKTSQENFVSISSPHPANLQSLADQVLLQAFSPPAVLVNDAGDILYISGRTGKYLEPAAGKANWNIHVMARPGIRTQLAVALRQVAQDKTSVELSGLKVEDDAPFTVNLTVQAVHEPKALEGMFMIVFREVAESKRSKARKKADAGSPDPALINELDRAREEIRALRQEMQASKEELQAANDALQSANEELQSANEELTTSKEEAQSMNEELQTINGELQTKLDDLALAQSDMQNLLNSTDIATLFLDNDLNVRRFTEQATSIYHLRDGDIGRPLSDLANTLTYPELHNDAKETLRTLTSSEKQVQTTDKRWFTVRIMPYRTLTNMIQGVVITFVDITVAKELESRLRKG